MPDVLTYIYSLYFQILGSIWADLTQFGERVATDLFDLSRECEENPPQLRHHEAWGKRTDQLITCDAWKKMKAVSAEEGLISIAYERKHAEWRYPSRHKPLNQCWYNVGPTS